MNQPQSTKILRNRPFGRFQRVKKVHVIPREHSDRGNPFPKKAWFIGKLDKNETFWRTDCTMGIPFGHHASVSTGSQ